jgi:hypothetical protein
MVAVLLVIAGAVLGLLGGVIWAAAAPRVVYQVATLNPPTAFATNPETSAFIAADGVYSFIALGGGALLGLAGYLLGVRRYGPVPMAGIVLGSVAAAFLARWLGPQLTGQNSFNKALGSSKVGTVLHAPIALGAQGALAFWPMAAALVAGGLELLSVMRARQALQGSGSTGPAYGRHSQRRRAAGLWQTSPQQGAAQSPPGPQASPGPQAWPDPSAVRAQQQWAEPAPDGRQPASPDEELPPDSRG